MMDVYDCIDRIKKASQDLVNDTEKLNKYDVDCDYEKLIKMEKKCLQKSSDLFLLNEELLRSLKEFCPSLSGSGQDRILDIECETMGISVKRLIEFKFPVYRISLPILLPNMHRRKEDFYNPVTMTVNSAVNRFCRENDIQPFHHAVVIFLTYCKSPQMMVNNDYNEASVIINGLIGHFIRDDSPFACDNSYCFKYSEDNYKTEIYITDREHYLEVYPYII